MNENINGNVITRSLGETNIRWEDVHRRLADMSRKLAETGHNTPELRHAILKERARKLALSVKSGVEEGKQIRVVEFDLAREHYAIEHAYVREVIPLREFTQIPGTPSFILGVIVVRGRIVSLMDLRRCLGLPPTGLVNGAWAVVLADDHMEFAILADRVIGLRTLRMESLQLSVTAVTGIGAKYLLGVAPDGLVVFNGETILTDPRMIVRTGEGEKV